MLGTLAKKSPTKNLLLLSLAALLLAGCAEKWQKPGGTGTEFLAAYDICRARSFDRFPSQFESTPNLNLPQARPIMTRCESGNTSVVCLPVKCNYFWPPLTPYCALAPAIMPTDYKEDVRRADFRVCMIKNGWRPLN